MNLSGRSKASLSRLKFAVGDAGVEVLNEWALVEDYWSTQPATNILCVFVELPAGEWSFSLLHIRSVDVVFHHPLHSHQSCRHWLCM
jgi:hypothetical protein